MANTADAVQTLGLTNRNPGKGGWCWLILHIRWLIVNQQKHAI